MKKRFSLLLAVLFLAPIALSWSNPGTEKPAATTGAQSKQVIVFFWDDRDSNPADQERVRQYIVKQSGVDFNIRKVKTEDEYNTQMTVALAGKDPIDVIQLLDTQTVTDFRNRGALKDITDSIARYGQDLRKNIPADSWRAVTDENGRIWSVPTQTFQNQARALQVRTDWRQKLGLPAIQTLTDLENYLRKVRDSDLDGNGKNDTIPMINTDETYSGYEGALLYLFTETVPDPSLDQTANYIDANGNVTPVPMHPMFKEYLRKMAQWNQEGLIYSETYSAKANQLRDLVAANRAGATAGWYSSTYRPWQTLLKTVPNASWEIIQPRTLKGNPYRFKKDNPGAPQLQIVSYSPVADAAIRFIDWFATSKENYITMKQGVPNQDWVWVDQDKTIIKNLVDKTDPTKSYNYAFSFFFNGPWNPNPANPDWLIQQYNAGNAVILPVPALWNPDWFVPYNFKGTPVENSFADANTLLSEAEVNIILGKRPVDDWDNVIAQYRKLFGDQYVQIATAQYKKYVK